MMFKVQSTLAIFVVSMSPVLLTSCAEQYPEMPKAIVDLSPAIGEDFPLRSHGAAMLEAFQLRDSTNIEPIITEEPFYVAMSYITLWNHVGTHSDPPNHVIKGANSIDQIPLEKFYGQAKVLDFRAKRKDEPLLRSDFENKGIEPGDVVIAFVGYTPPTNPDELPSYAYLSGEAAEYLATIPVKAFATDMPALMGFKAFFQLFQQEGLRGSEDFLPEHYAFLSRGIPAIEGLVNLERIVEEDNIIFAGFPLKIKDGNGGPLRAAALVY
jgi:kynurenine formamidase